MNNDLAIMFSLLELGQPWMIAFMAGAIIPILIHYWHRQSHVKVAWAATHYLKLALKKVARRYSFLQWLLLLLRVALVLLMGLALAGPVLRNSELPFSGLEQAKRLKVIVIDTSLSMLANEQSHSRIEEAKWIASGLIENASDSDVFMIFTFDSDLKSFSKQPSGARQRILSQIDSVHATHYASRWAKFGELLKSELLSVDLQAYEKKELHLISDFARVNIAELTTAEGFEFLRTSTDQIQNHSVSKSKLSNNFVSRISTPVKLSIARQVVPVQVEIGNWGSGTSQTLSVDLFVNQQLSTSKQVNVPANGNVLAEFEFRPETEGEQLIEARIGSDCMVEDNRRFLTISCRRKFRLLLLEGRPRGSRFLKLALDPASDSNSPYEIQVASADDLPRISLDDIDILVMDNVRQLDQPNVNRVKKYVKSGKHLVTFLGDLVDRLNFNETWNDETEGRLGLQLQKIQPVEQYRVDTLEFAGKLLGAFRGNPQAGLDRLPIWCYYAMSADNDSNWEPELAIDNGDPLLIARKFGNGGIVVFASSSSSDSRARDPDGDPDGVPWNANETSPTFPALIQELFSSLNQIADSPEWQVGDRAVGLFLSRFRIDSISLMQRGNSDSENPAVDISFQQQDDQVLWQTEEFPRPGIFQLEAKAGSRQIVQSVAINLNSEESDLRVAEDLTQAAATQVTVGETTGQQLQLFQLLLMLLAIGMIAETILAFKFGRGNG